MKGSLIGVAIAVGTTVTFLSGLIGFAAGVVLMAWAQDRSTSYPGRMRYQSYSNMRRPAPSPPMSAADES